MRRADPGQGAGLQALRARGGTVALLSDAVARDALASDALAGALVGQALADALGFVVEARAADAAAEYAGGLTWSGPLRSHPHFTPGQYSDDTQQARLLCESLAASGTWRPDDFAARLVAHFTSSADVGAGPGTRAAVMRMVAGVPWTEAAAPSTYFGNGAAMRAAPIGLLFAPPRLEAVAVAQARVTHASPLCQAGAVAVASAARGFACGAPADVIITGAVTAAAAVSSDAAEAFARVGTLLALPPVEAARMLARHRLDPSAPPEFTGVTGHVLPSVVWALYAALRAPEDWRTAVRVAIGVGGDTDTTAAIAGALVGARVGLAGLPADWLAQVHDAGAWRAPELAALAARAVGAVRAPALDAWPGEP